MSEATVLATPEAETQEWRYVGRGRSGVVFRHRDATRGWVVRKWFRPDRASRWILRLFTGAPNPYAWSEDAVRGAVVRRRVLRTLCDHWFGGALRVPETFGSVRSEDPARLGIEMAFVPGRHAPLRSTFTGRTGRTYGKLRAVMHRLQAHLEEAGFDGLLWQAGLGNPVAASNFLEGDPDGSTWTWIDLESGMLPLVPANPWRLFSHYLPACVRHRAWLFDDVDTTRLLRYVHRHQGALVASLGADGTDTLIGQVEALGRHQAAWRKLRRHQRALSWRAFEARITAEEKARYWTRPLAWYGRGAARAPAAVARTVARGLRKAWRVVRSVPYGTWTRRIARFLVSTQIRRRWSRRYVLGRVRAWRARQFITRERIRELRADLRRKDTSEAIADFGVHLACKPAIELIQWIVTPLLFAIGWIPDARTAALVMLLTGSAVRTAYTVGRSVQALWAGHAPPWIALVVGTLPSLGTLAFPSEIAWRGAARGDRLGQFVLYDTSARFGRWFPIWGGRDTGAEHLANRVPDVLHALLEPRETRRPS